MTSRSDSETVLVIGGRGFVGSHLIRALIAAGLKPHLFGPAMADDLLADVAGNFEETEGSVEDRAAIADTILRSGARSLVTTAAHSVGRQGLMRSGDAEADRAFAVNVLGFRNVLEAALETGIRRVIWSGSTVVYAPAARYGPEPVNEDAPTGPVTLYGLTKLLSEDLARYYRDRHRLDVIGLRLPLVLGPGLWYQGAASAITGIMTEAAPGKRHVVAFHDEPMDLMHVSDVGRALVETLRHESALDAVYNIKGFTARLSDIAKAAEKAVPGYVVELTPTLPVLTFPLIDDTRFRSELGFTPDYGLDDVVAAMLPLEIFHD